MPPQRNEPVLSPQTPADPSPSNSAINHTEKDIFNFISSSVRRRLGFLRRSILPAHLHSGTRRTTKTVFYPNAGLLGDST
jgi:hypothetical protein